MIRFSDQLSKVMMVLTAVWALGLSLLIVADFIGNNVYGGAILGVRELVITSVVMIVYLQLGYAIRSHSMLRADSLLLAMPDTLPAQLLRCSSLEILCADVVMVCPLRLSSSRKVWRSPRIGIPTSQISSQVFRANLLPHLGEPNDSHRRSAAIGRSRACRRNRASCAERGEHIGDRYYIRIFHFNVEKICFV